MDEQEYRELIAILQSLLDLAQNALQADADTSKGDLKKMQAQILKAIEAYREKANAHRP
jgi:ElaB/YqjD/DUF883 family membrane-anchored ribosome-binding protein